jgi:ComF family protein
MGIDYRQYYSPWDSLAMPVRSLLDSFLALLFPDRCGGCACLGELLCQRCRASFQPYPYGSDRFPASLNDIRVAFLFSGPLREAVHQFKYRRVRRLALPLGALMAASLVQRPLTADAVLPVPLHHDRLVERGFNQAEELACEVAHSLRLPLIAGGLSRIRATEQQAHLDARARAENMRGAFRWHGAHLPYRVLLVDDVLTTGATMGACAEALRDAGAKVIYGLALARSRPDHVGVSPTRKQKIEDRR